MPQQFLDTGFRFRPFDLRRRRLAAAIREDREVIGSLPLESLSRKMPPPRSAGLKGGMSHADMRVEEHRVEWA